MCHNVCGPVPAIWYPVHHCRCAWGCYFGCTCHHCHYQPAPVVTCTPAPAPIEKKIDRILELAEAEEKRRLAVNKKRSHRW